MSLSQSNNMNSIQVENKINGALLEKVIIGNDLSGLSSIEKVQYVKQICQTLNLNPLTKPIQLMKFQGKEIPYFTKDATEQLRKNNNVSIKQIDTKMLDGGIYVVTAYASTSDGRQDSSTGVISISGLKGDAMANAMMKAETKAKRRVTLSICGLGFIDECEVDSIPNSTKVEINPIIELPKNDDVVKNIEPLNIDEMNLEISQTNSIEELEKVYKHYYKKCVKNHDNSSLDILMKSKDSKKSQLNKKDFNDEYDSEVVVN